MKPIILFIFLLILYFNFIGAAPSLNSSIISGVFHNGTDYIFSPNNDGIYNEAIITMNSSELVKWGTIFIYNSSWEKVDRFNAQSTFKYNRTETWDGHYSSSYGNSSLIVPDGIYRINTSIENQTGSIVNLTASQIFVDNSKPTFSNYNSDNSTSSNNTQLNATLSENNLQKVVLEFNGTNYTVTTNISNVFYFTILSGNYSGSRVLTYNWYANDSVGNFNKSFQQSFAVSAFQSENPEDNTETKDYSIKSKKMTFPVSYINESSQKSLEMINLQEKSVYRESGFGLAISLLTLTSILLLTLIVLIAKAK